MTAIGYVIQPGEAIPDDVTEVEDRTEQDHERGPDGRWHMGGVNAGDPNPWDSDELMDFAPLTVTAVREQPAEPVSGLCEAGADKVTCIVMAADHRRIYHSGRPVPPYASTEALLKVAEPQQPVQARGPDGWPWWIHHCGRVLGSTEAPRDDDPRCGCNRPGPWRPLLVGGDPAPERTPPTHDDFKRLAGIKRNLHEPHVDGPREPSTQERADHELMTALGVERIEEVMPAIERLKAAQPDPLVLSLPEGTVDAVVKAARRWYYEHGYKPGYLPRNLLGSDRDLKLAVEQLAPPREPRTWPKLAEEPDLPRCVEVDGYGRWRRMTPTSTLYGSLDRDRLPTAPISIGQLRELGDVTEVTE